MTTNCKIELFGTLDKAPKLVNNKETSFLAMTVMTRHVFKEETTGKQKEKTLWHKVMAFDPEVIQVAKGLQKGERLHITGTLSYKPVDTADGYKTSHASIIATGVSIE